MFYELPLSPSLLFVAQRFSKYENTSWLKRFYDEGLMPPTFLGDKRQFVRTLSALETLQHSTRNSSAQTVSLQCFSVTSLPRCQVNLLANCAKLIENNRTI